MKAVGPTCSSQAAGDDARQERQSAGNTWAYLRHSAASNHWLEVGGCARWWEEPNRLIHHEGILCIVDSSKDAMTHKPKT
jgi:hypothetical protein